MPRRACYTKILQNRGGSPEEQKKFIKEDRKAKPNRRCGRRPVVGAKAATSIVTTNGEERGSECISPEGGVSRRQVGLNAG